MVYVDPATNRSYTYAQVKSTATEFGKGLKGLWDWQKGDVLALYTPNCIDTPAITWGTHWAGGIVSPANPGYTVDALVALLFEMEESCVHMSSAAYEIVLRALQKDQLVEDLKAETSKADAPRQLETILEIMENMQLRKLQIPYDVALDALANELWRITDVAAPVLLSHSTPILCHSLLALQLAAHLPPSPSRQQATFG